MSAFDSFIGNEKLKDRLMKDIRSGGLSHAYIIEGPEGSGKKTLAKLICAAVSCRAEEPPCMKCDSCYKIFSDISPDVITVTPDADRVQLGVDVIRRLIEDASFAANDLENKFYIIPDCDLMNRQAQNSLLKILEEPPVGVMFLLLCKNAETLLPTVRSRAPSLRLEAVDDDRMAEWLLENSGNAGDLNKKSPEEFKNIIRMSCGSIGKALELCDPKKADQAAKLREAAYRLVELVANRRDRLNDLEFYEYASKLSQFKQRDELVRVYSLTAEAFRDLIASKLTESFKPLFYSSFDEASGFAQFFPLERLMKLYDIFLSAADNLGLNTALGLAKASTASAVLSAVRR